VLWQKRRRWANPIDCGHPEDGRSRRREGLFEVVGEIDEGVDGLDQIVGTSGGAGPVGIDGAIDDVEGAKLGGGLGELVAEGGVIEVVTAGIAVDTVDPDITLFVEGNPFGFPEIDGVAKCQFQRGKSLFELDVEDSSDEFLAGGVILFGGKADI